MMHRRNVRGNLPRGRCHRPAGCFRPRRARCFASILLVVSLALLTDSRALGGDVLVVHSGELCIQTGENAPPPEQRAAQLVAEQIARRTGLELAPPRAAKAKHRLHFGTVQSNPEVAAFCAADKAAASLGPDGFLLATGLGVDHYLVGQSSAGCVAGAGALLRMCRYAPGALGIPAVRVAESPDKPIRGIYFATHFFNYYHTAPVAEVGDYIEELALSGNNLLQVWFDMHHFPDSDDPAARAHLERLADFARRARGVGMKFGMGFLSNEGFATTPEPLKARREGRCAHYGVEVCPSVPGGMELIARNQTAVLDAFREPVDILWTWPYDQGGCACERCAPWGANGFLRTSAQMAKLYKERFPRGELWLSTWWFSDEDWRGLLQAIDAGQADWMDGMISNVVSEEHLRRAETHGYRLALFPEISMDGMSPWGGHGANPLLAKLGPAFPGNGPLTHGGWPYSEGIYEDLNKFLCARAFWTSGQKQDDVLAEYATYYFGAQAAEKAVRLFHRLAQTHGRRNWRVPNLAEADEAWELAQAIDAELPGWAKNAWRWRLVYVRAKIDHLLKHGEAGDAAVQAELTPLCDEIRTIYHVDSRTLDAVRPPAYPPPPDPQALARGKRVAASSTHPQHAGSERMLTDGILSQDDGYNFWIQDPDREKTATLTVDLGAVQAIREVRLQFRCIHGVYWFVPAAISVAVSQDGAVFIPISNSAEVPKEGTPYSAGLWSCRLGRPARYVRVELGPSQHTKPPFPGVLEVTEIEVQGE